MEIVEHDIIDASAGSDPVSSADKRRQAPVSADKRRPPAAVTGSEGSWQIKVSLAPEGDVDDWLKIIDETCQLALDNAGSADDVMQIFKKNKQLFDAVKAQDADYFKDLMAMFTAAKNKFAE